MRGKICRSGSRGFGTANVYEPARLAEELDEEVWRQYWQAFGPRALKTVEAYRDGETADAAREDVELFIAVARPLGKLVAKLFRVEKEHQALLWIGRPARTSSSG